MLEERLKIDLDRKTTDENDPSRVNERINNTSRGTNGDLTRSKNTSTSTPLALHRNPSNLSAKLRDIEFKKDFDDDRKSELSRKGSHRTNISRRYQQPDDEDEDQDEKDSQRSSSQVSCSGLSQTYSQKKTDSYLDKRHTHDIKSLERLCQPTSTKSIKGRDTSQDLKKKLFSNTGDQLINHVRKHKSDIFSTQEPKMDESAEREIGSRILYKKHFVIP